MTGKSILMGVAFMLCSLVPIRATSLEDMLTQAKKQSSTIQLLELNKEQSDIAMGLSEAEEDLAVEVTGEATYADSFAVDGTTYAEANISISPTVVLTLPDDGDTTITIGVGSLTKSLDSTNWMAVPTVSVSHTIEFGNTGDALDDLNLAKQKLEVEQGYSEGILEFENTVYAKVQEILEYEKTMLTSQQEIKDQQTVLSNALTLKTTSKDSATYKSMQLALAKLENALVGTKQKYELAKAQFSLMTTLTWEGVEAVREADLTFSVMPTGDTSVVIAALAVEIAKEELAIEEQTGLSSLAISGSGNLTAVNAASTSVSYSMGAGASLIGDKFSAGAKLNMDISATGTLSPSLTLSGSWKNNSTSTSDNLKIQQLKNAVTIASIDYQEEMNDYLTAANQLQSDILSHRIEVQQLEETITYNKAVLEQAKEKFSKGLGLQSAIDSAQLTLDENRYDLTILMIDALVLENQAHVLQL